MNKDDKITYSDLHLPNKYLRYLFEARLKLKGKGENGRELMKFTKYSPEKTERIIELIVTNNLGYEPIRTNHVVNRNLNRHLGKMDLRKMENSLETYKYLIERFSGYLINYQEDLEEIIENKKSEIEEIKSELNKNNPLYIIRKALNKAASIFW